MRSLLQDCERKIEENCEKLHELTLEKETLNNDLEQMAQDNARSNIEL